MNIWLGIFAKPVEAMGETRIGLGNGVNTGDRTLDDIHIKGGVCDMAPRGE